MTGQDTVEQNVMSQTKTDIFPSSSDQTGAAVSGTSLTRVLEQADLIFLRGLHLANGVGRLTGHFCDTIFPIGQDGAFTLRSRVRRP